MTQKNHREQQPEVINTEILKKKKDLLLRLFSIVVPAVVQLLLFLSFKWESLINKYDLQAYAELQLKHFNVYYHSKPSSNNSYRKLWNLSFQYSYLEWFCLFLFTFLSEGKGTDHNIWVLEMFTNKRLPCHQSRLWYRTLPRISLVSSPVQPHFFMENHHLNSNSEIQTCSFWYSYIRKSAFLPSFEEIRSDSFWPAVPREEPGEVETAVSGASPLQPTSLFVTCLTLWCKGLQHLPIFISQS